MAYLCIAERLFLVAEPGLTPDDGRAKEDVKPDVFSFKIVYYEKNQLTQVKASCIFFQ